MTSIPYFAELIRQSLQERDAEIQRLREEQQILERVLSAVRGAAKPQEQPQPPERPRRPRRRPKATPLPESEAIRVVVRLRRCTARQFAKATGLSTQAARQVLIGLAARTFEGQPRPVVRVVDQAASTSSRLPRVYEYIDPRKLPGPTSRRSVSASTRDSSLPVPHTGKPVGPSGKPGLDRKAAKKGRRVKRGRQGT